MEFISRPQVGWWHDEVGDGSGVKVSALCTNCDGGDGVVM